MPIDYLVDSDDHKVTRHSSIYQYSGVLSVVEKGEIVPIAFDMIDGIDCDKVYSHKIMVTLEPWIGYEFPVGECKYRDISYFFGQDDTPQIEVLPDWFGEGIYESRGVKNIVPTGDGGALGLDQAKTLRVGLDYVLANDYIDGEE